MDERRENGLAPVLDSALAEATLDKVKALLEPLGRQHQAALFHLVHAGKLGRTATADRIADLLLDLLKGKRTAHARRLWTGWLDPVLLRDEPTLDCAERLPGSMHLVDAGAWWLALSRRMPELVGRIQAAMEQACRRRPLDAVLDSEIGRQAAEELRRRSQEEIARVRDNQPERAKLLADANDGRNRLLKDRGRGAGARLSAHDLDTLALMLDVAPQWRRVAPTGLQTTPRKALSDARDLVDGGTRPEGAVLLPIAHLHADRDPHWLIQLEEALPGLLLVEHATAHLRFSGQRLRDTLTVELEGLARARPRPGLGATAGAAVDDVFAWYDSVLALGFHNQPRGAAAVQEIMASVLGFFEDEVVPAVNRQIQALTPTMPPSGTIEFVRLVGRMSERLDRRGLVGARKPWTVPSAEHVAELFRDVSADGTANRLPLLAQLAELAGLMGAPVELSALNHGLLRTVEGALKERRDFAEAEMRLIEQVLTTSAEERRNCKWWAAPELVSLLDTAATTDIGAAILDRFVTRRRA